MKMTTTTAKMNNNNNGHNSTVDEMLAKNGSGTTTLTSPLTSTTTETTTSSSATSTSVYSNDLAVSIFTSMTPQPTLSDNLTSQPHNNVPSLSVVASTSTSSVATPIASATATVDSLIAEAVNKGGTLRTQKASVDVYHDDQQQPLFSTSMNGNCSNSNSNSNSNNNSISNVIENNEINKNTTVWVLTAYQAHVDEINNHRRHRHLQQQQQQHQLILHQQKQLQEQHVQQQRKTTTATKKKKTQVKRKSLSLSPANLCDSKNDSSNKQMSNNNNNDSNQDNGKKKRSSKEQLWTNKLLELIDYKIEFKHTNVPQRYAKNKPLGLWVKRQRCQYKLVKEGKPSPLTKERIVLLNKLGFVWEVYDSVWEKQLQQLVDFNNEFNHTHVPNKYTQNKQLGEWVATQRKQYKLIVEGKSSSLTKERIELLNKLGFAWRFGIGKGTRKATAPVVSSTAISLLSSSNDDPNDDSSPSNNTGNNNLFDFSLTSTSPSTQTSVGKEDENDLSVATSGNNDNTAAAAIISLKNKDEDDTSSTIQTEEIPSSTISMSGSSSIVIDNNNNTILLWENGTRTSGLLATGVQEQEPDEQQPDCVGSSIPDFRIRKINFDDDNDDDENKDD